METNKDFLSFKNQSSIWDEQTFCLQFINCSQVMVMMRCVGVMVMTVTLAVVTGQENSGRGFSHSGFTMYPTRQEFQHRNQNPREHDPNTYVQHPANPIPADSGLAKAFWNQPGFQQQQPQQQQQQHASIRQPPPLPQNSLRQPPPSLLQNSLRQPPPSLLQNSLRQSPPPQRPSLQRRQDQDLRVEEEPPRWVNQQAQNQRRTNQNTPPQSHQPIHFRDPPSPIRERPQHPPPPPLQKFSEDIEAIIADALDESKPVMFV